MFRALAGVALVSATALAGPPFQTDDPEPIDFRHYEFYTFGSSDGTPVETDTVGPAFEFNYGPLPNVHLHIIAPLAAIFPSNNPALAPAGTGPSAVGLGDIELGIKYRFVQETAHCPMIGTFTMFEMPTGNAPKGLGVGRTWYKAPLWVQKSFGPWTTYGGGGETVRERAGLSQLSIRGLACAARYRQEGDARDGTLLSRTGRIGDGANQAGDDGRFRRLLQIPRPRISIAVLLRPHRRRANRKLRVSGALLDLGQGR